MGRHLKHHLFIGLMAGIPAIIVNMLLLAAADRIGIATAHGGLLRLLGHIGATVTGPAWWQHHVLPVTHTHPFQQMFHFVVGLFMAMGYGLVPGRLARRPAIDGLLWALVVWLLNAAIVLPAIGEGFAGSRHLTATGMIGFAIAHTSFFVLLALLYGQWTGRHRHQAPA